MAMRCPITTPWSPGSCNIDFGPLPVEKPLIRIAVPGETAEEFMQAAAKQFRGEFFVAIDQPVGKFVRIEAPFLSGDVGVRGDAIAKPAVRHGRKGLVVRLVRLDSDSLGIPIPESTADELPPDPADDFESDTTKASNVSATVAEAMKQSGEPALVELDDDAAAEFHNDTTRSSEVSADLAKALAVEPPPDIPTPTATLTTPSGHVITPHTIRRTPGQGVARQVTPPQGAPVTGMSIPARTPPPPPPGPSYLDDDEVELEIVAAEANVDEPTSPPEPAPVAVAPPEPAIDELPDFSLDDATIEPAAPPVTAPSVASSPTPTASPSLPPLDPALPPLPALGKLPPLPALAKRPTPPAGIATPSPSIDTPSIDTPSIETQSPSIATPDIAPDDDEDADWVSPAPTLSTSAPSAAELAIDDAWDTDDEVPDPSATENDDGDVAMIASSPPRDDS